MQASLDSDTKPEVTPPRHWLLLVWAAFGVIAAWRVVYATAPYGPGVSGDSLQYFSAALDMAAGDTIKGWQDGMYVSWPPLYPALLYALSFLGGSQVETARWLNVAALGLTVFAFGAFSLRHIRSPSVRALGTAAACTAAPLFSMAVMVWSEPVFLFLVIAQLATLTFFLETRSKAALALAAVLAAAACMQRYPGVTLIGVSGLAILFPLGNAKFIRRVIEGALFGVIAAAPLALWMKRNKDLEGIATSWAGGETIPIPSNVASTFETLFAWLMPSSLIYRMAMIVLLVITVPPVVYALIRSGIAKGHRVPFALHGFFAFVFAGFLCYSGSRYSIEPINERYLAPVYLSLVLLAVTLVDGAVAYWRDRELIGIPGKTVAIMLVVLCAMSLYYPFLSIRVKTANYRRAGVFGYTKAEYTNSPLDAAAREQIPRDAVVYSNRPELLFVHAGIPSPIAYEDNDALRAAIAEARPRRDAVYLVWFSSAYGATGAAPAADLLNSARTLAAMPEGEIRVWNAPANISPH